MQYLVLLLCCKVVVLTASLMKSICLRSIHEVTNQMKKTNLINKLNMYLHFGHVRTDPCIHHKIFLWTV